MVYNSQDLGYSVPGATQKEAERERVSTGLWFEGGGLEFPRVTLYWWVSNVTAEI